MEPEELARRLGITGRRLRDWLRRRYPRGAIDHGARWSLTPEQVAEASRHFGFASPRPRDLDSAPQQQRANTSTMQADDVAIDAARARRVAGLKYRPDRVRLLLVAEAPPLSLERYFYFEDVGEQDSLFRYVVRGLFEVVPARHDKRRWLGRLRDACVFLIDVSEEPSGASALGRHVSGCVDRCRELAPEAIVLIKANVYDAMFGSLRNAGLPVIDRRVPFPGSGQQKSFEVAFAEALDIAGVEHPIRSGA
jgi:hypothetical protein